MEISKWLCRCACSPVFGQRSRLRLFWRVWNAHLARYHAVSCRRSSPPASSSPKRHRSLALNKNTLLSVVFNGVFFFVWHFGVKRRWPHHTHSSCIGSTCATSQTVITSSLPAAKQSKHISQMAAESSRPLCRRNECDAVDRMWIYINIYICVGDGSSCLIYHQVAMECRRYYAAYRPLSISSDTAATRETGFVEWIRLFVYSHG